MVVWVVEKETGDATLHGWRAPLLDRQWVLGGDGRRSGLDSSPQPFQPCGDARSGRWGGQWEFGHRRRRHGLHRDRLWSVGLPP